jgi:hypothetical protein
MTMKLSVLCRRGTLAVTGALMFANASMAADLFDETKATTIFAFDSVSIPHIQNLRVEMRTPTQASRQSRRAARCARNS